MFLTYEIEHISALPIDKIKDICEILRVDNKSDERISIFREAGDEKNFYPPAKIFGTPANSECLNDVRLTTFTTPKIELYCLNNARTIGFKALWSNNSVYMPNFHPDWDGLKADFKNISLINTGFILGENEIYVKKFPIKFNEGVAFFISDLEPGNFGSFCFRTLPQLLLLKSIIEKVNLGFDLFILPDNASWTIEALSALFPDKNFITYKVSGAYLFRKIYFFNIFSFEGLYSNRLMTVFRKNLFEAFNIGTSNKQGSKKIFISRKHSIVDRPNYRPLMNEHKLETIALSLGYEIIYPERMSFSKQLSIIAHADKVVATSGSNVYPVLYSLKKPTIMHLESFTVSVRQAYKLFASAECQYYALFGTFFDDKVRITAPWKIDENLFKNALIEMDSST